MAPLSHFSVGANNDHVNSMALVWRMPDGQVVVQNTEGDHANSDVGKYILLFDVDKNPIVGVSGQTGCRRGVPSGTITWWSAYSEWEACPITFVSLLQHMDDDGSLATSSDSGSNRREVSAGTKRDNPHSSMDFKPPHGHVLVSASVCGKLPFTGGADLAIFAFALDASLAH